MTKRVLVTGGSGFIGKYCLLSLLNKDFEIHAISYRNENSVEGVKWHKINLLDRKSCHRIINEIQPTHLLHTAWIATPSVFWSSPENILWLKFSIELLDAFGKKGGKRVIGIGTCAEYDSSYGICSEARTPLKADTIYGITKNAMNNACTALSKIYGFSFAWGRLFFPYGPGEPNDKLISKIINSIKHKKIINCTHGRQIRDFIYITDVAEAITTLLDSEVEGAFNIASGNPISIYEVILEIISQMGGKRFVRIGGIETRKNEAPVLVADMQRTLKYLNWQPTVLISVGISNMIEEAMKV